MFIGPNPIIRTLMLMLLQDGFQITLKSGYSKNSRYSFWIESVALWGVCSLSFARLASVIKSVYSVCFRFCQCLVNPVNCTGVWRLLQHVCRTYTVLYCKWKQVEIMSWNHLTNSWRCYRRSWWGAQNKTSENNHPDRVGECRWLLYKLHKCDFYILL